MDKDRILAISKCDKLDDELMEEIKNSLPKDLNFLFISSVSQIGLTQLKDKIWIQLNSDE